MAIYNSYGLSEQKIEGYGHLTIKAKIIEPTVVTSQNSVRVYFSKEMSKDENLIDINNYLIYPSISRGAPVSIVEITPENSLNPVYVDIKTSEFTNGMVYYLKIKNVFDSEGVENNDEQSGFYLLGIGEKPEIVSITSTSKTTFLIVFSETMFENDIIKDPNQYIFDKGLTVNKVEFFNDRVLLTTNEQISGELYTLTVYSDIESPLLTEGEGGEVLTEGEGGEELSEGE